MPDFARPAISYNSDSVHSVTIASESRRCSDEGIVEWKRKFVANVLAAPWRDAKCALSASRSTWEVERVEISTAPLRSPNLTFLYLHDNLSYGSSRGNAAQAPRGWLFCKSIKMGSDNLSLLANDGARSHGHCRCQLDMGQRESLQEFPVRDVPSRPFHEYSKGMNVGSWV